MTKEEISKLDVAIVPHNILLQKRGKKLGLVSSDLEMVLFKEDFGYSITEGDPEEMFRDARLIPVTQTDLKEGDLAFRVPIDTTEYEEGGFRTDRVDFSKLPYYCIIVDKERYIYMNQSNEVRTSTLSWEAWYKVKI